MKKNRAETICKFFRDNVLTEKANTGFHLHLLPGSNLDVVLFESTTPALFVRGHLLLRFCEAFLCGGTTWVDNPESVPLLQSVQVFLKVE